MNLLIEKKKIKQQIDNINEESIILSIKKFLGMIKEKLHVPFTEDELISRALESEEAIRAKKYVSIDELEKEMKNW